MRTRLIDNYTCSNARRSPAERELRWKPGGLPPVGGRERLPCFIIVHSHQQWDGATQMLNAQSPRRKLSRSPPESIAWIFFRRPSKAPKCDLCLSPATQHQSCGPPAPTHGDPKYCQIDKAVLTLAEPRRRRDKSHLRFVASQPCLICARHPSDPHHLRFAQPRGLGVKVSDEFAVPLCCGNHRQLHQAGNEIAWWKGLNVDALSLARQTLGTNPSQ